MSSLRPQDTSCDASESSKGVAGETAATSQASEADQSSTDALKTDANDDEVATSASLLSAMEQYVADHPSIELLFDGETCSPPSHSPLMHGLSPSPTPPQEEKVANANPPADVLETLADKSSGAGGSKAPSNVTQPHLHQAGAAPLIAHGPRRAPAPAPASGPLGHPHGNAFDEEFMLGDDYENEMDLAAPLSGESSP